MIHHLKKTKNQIIASTNKDNKKQKNTSTAKTDDEVNVILFVWMAFISWLGIKKLKKEDLQSINTTPSKQWYLICIDKNIVTACIDRQDMLQYKT